MTQTEYARFLADLGFGADEAQRVARCRIAAARAQRPGNIRVEARSGGEAELLLYDAIGFDYWSGGGITPQWLVDKLEEIGPVDRIVVRVNSPGGDVFDAMTIYQILRRQQATIAVEVEGLAASAASYVIQAASPGELRIAESGMLMVHRAWGGVMGNTNDMREMADVLAKLDGQIAGIYAARSGRPATEFLKLMDAETWLTGEEAVAAKLADSFTTPVKAAACLNPEWLAGFKNMPTAWLERAKAAKVREEEAVKMRVRLLDLECADAL